MDGRTIRVSSLGHTDTQTHNTQTHRLPLCVSACVKCKCKFGCMYKCKCECKCA